MMRRMYPLLVAALLALLLAGCGSSGNGGTTNVPNAIPESSPASSVEQEQSAVPSSDSSTSSEQSKPSESSSPEPVRNSEAVLKQTARDVVEFLRERDLKSLARRIDSEQGLRFSRYPRIIKETDLVFKPDELPTFKEATMRTWGVADGSGDPIELTFRDYYEKFIYNEDFADAPDVNVNKIVGTGNMAFNADEAYPGSSYVEFHFPGFDDSLQGQDWQSLTLVFVPSGDDWKLVSIVHGQWTI